MRKIHFYTWPNYPIFFVSVLITVLLLNTGSASYKKQRDMSQKEAFQQRFPLTLSFRNDRLGQRDGYEFWERQHLPYNAITKKFLREEIDIDPVLPAMANQFARNHPEKLMLIHLNGECTSAEDRNTHKNLFPWSLGVPGRHRPIGAHQPLPTRDQGGVCRSFFYGSPYHSWRTPPWAKVSEQCDAGETRR
jgi:hypothetical protein